MNGAIIDTLITLPRRQHARRRGATEADIAYVQTRAGQLRYVDSGGNKPTVLTTPDGPCVIEHYRELIERLSVNFRVICFDMPGIGFSFPSSHYRFGIAESTDAVIEVMDALSISRAAVAFTCVNGFFAMNLAKRYPHRVSHLVLAQTPSMISMRKWTDRNVPSMLRVAYLGQIAGLIGAKQLATRWFDLSMPQKSKHKASFAEHARNAIRSGGCFCLASLVQGVVHSSDEDVLGVSCPTLMIYGDNDYSHKHTDFQTLTDAIPHARIVTFKGCGHFPNLEKCSEYVEHLQRFVLGESQRGGSAG